MAEIKPTARRLVKAMLLRLDAALLARGESYGEFAARVGIYAGRFSKWRAGQGEPGVEDLVRIADGLGVSLDRVVGRDPAPLAGREADPAVRLLLDIVLEGPGSVGPIEAIRRIRAGDPGGPPAAEVVAPVIAPPRVRRGRRPTPIDES